MEDYVELERLSMTFVYEERVIQGVGGLYEYQYRNKDYAGNNVGEWRTYYRTDEFISLSFHNAIKDILANLM